MCGEGNKHRCGNCRKQDAMRIKDRWRRWQRLSRDVSVKYRDESRAAVGADGVQVFRVRIRSGDWASMTQQRSGRFKILFIKSVHQSGMVFRWWSVGAAATVRRLEDVTHHFQRPAKWQRHWRDISSIFGRPPRKQHVQIYAFTVWQRDQRLDMSQS